VDYETVMRPATTAALQRLKEARLLRPYEPKPQDWQWCATGRGLAVFNSALPTQQGSGLYQALQDLRTGVCTLDGGITHLSFILLGSSPGSLNIKGWPEWHSALAKLLGDANANGSALPRVEREVARFRKTSRMRRAA
jgi:hypothetical protein